MLWLCCGCVVAVLWLCCGCAHNTVLVPTVVGGNSTDKVLGVVRAGVIARNRRRDPVRAGITGYTLSASGMHCEAACLGGSRSSLDSPDHAFPALPIHHLADCIVASTTSARLVGRCPRTDVDVDVDGVVASPRHTQMTDGSSGPYPNVIDLREIVATPGADSLLWWL